MLAHALGTSDGAFLAAKTAAAKPMNYAIAGTIFFPLGGITNAFLLPAPVWFIIVDLVLAYLPMG